MYAVKFAEAPQPSEVSRHLVEQLNAFVLKLDASLSSAVTSLGDALKALVKIKTELLNEASRVFFAATFVAHNGVTLLLRILTALPRIMQSVNAKPMFKGILSRKNSVAAVHHKACLTEATTMECLKLIFDQLATTRDIMLREPTSVAAVLQFVVTGQLDTKCYALEICSMLLDMPRGFQTLFQHLTALAARHAQYKRLATIMAQIHLGLETRRVHFQLIVARLMNKLISKAPTPSHRMLVLSEATLVNYNSSFIEKMLLNANIAPVEAKPLLDEMHIWQKHCAMASLTSTGGSVASELVEPKREPSDSGSFTRNAVRMHTRAPPATSLVRNLERRRLRRHGESSDDFTTSRPGSAAAIMNEGRHQPSLSTSQPARFVVSKMRRAKSESAIPQDEPPMTNGYSQPQAPVELRPDYSDYDDDTIAHEPMHRMPARRRLYRSHTHLVPSREDSPSPLTPLPTKENGLSRSQFDFCITPENGENDSVAMSHLSPRTSSSSEHAVNGWHVNGGRNIGRDVRANHDSTDAPKPLNSRPFSYLNPEQPQLDSVLPRAPPKGPLFDRHDSGYSSSNIIPPAQRPNGAHKVVHVPVNVVNSSSSGAVNGNRKLLRNKDAIRQSAFIRNEMNRESSFEGSQRSESHGSDELNAVLREFDYLNDYDAQSMRSAQKKPNVPSSATVNYRF